MLTVPSLFRKYCDSKYLPLGFIRHKNTYARMQNGMLQTFTLQRFSRSKWYTVCFGIVPLCNLILDLDIGHYELDEFYDDITIYGYGWAPDSISIDANRNCAAKITHAIDENLLPLFAECIDAPKALAALLKIEEKFDNNRKSFLHQVGSDDCAEPWQERSLFDDNKYWLAIKCRDYAYVKRCLSHQIKDCEILISEIESGNDPQPASVYTNAIAECESLRKRLRKLDNADYAFFEEMAETQEKQTLSWLRDTYPRLLDRSVWSEN